MPTNQTWTPQYSRWRHGGWYVDNVNYPCGAVGCISRNYPDKKWRIVCDPRRTNLGESGDFTFKNRDEAANAERELAESLRTAGVKFDQGDYNAFAGKYRRFRKARIAEIVGDRPGFDVGAFVRIEYFSAEPNIVRGNETMPIYKAWPAAETDDENFTMLFACALMDFCV